MARRPEGLARSDWSRGSLVLIAALALSACDGGPGLGLGGTDAPEGVAAIPGAEPNDVAAPDVFHVAEPGLWDGRPSLGGVWVAHPDVTDPERVRIVNTGNGQEVIGALFRRERDLPGPSLQVSSDAAEALGMLAGAPATLDVTALRRQAAPPPPAEPAPEAAPADAAPVATAAAPATATPAPQPAAPADAAAAAAVAAVARATAAIVAGTPDTPPAAAPAPAGAIATTTLDAAAPAGAAASPLRFPFVQLATISTEAAANQAAQGLAAKGLPARVVAVPGRPAWRLLLGPATTEAQQTALRERAVAEGYADAYLVRS